jgi:hypothetical protein
VAASPAAAPALASDDEPARVADATGAAVSSGEVARHRDGRRTMGRLPANLGRCAIGVWSADNLVPFLAGGAAASAASFADQEVRESAVATDWGDAFETGAGPVWSSVFVAGMFTAGRLSDGPRLRAMTYDMLDAAIVNFAYSEVIKVAVGRGRPNGEDNKSFPRGTRPTRSPSPPSPSGTTAGSSASPRTSPRGSSGRRCGYRPRSGGGREACRWPSCSEY